MTHRYFPRTARYASFTLVELLAVIAIIVLLAVVAIPAVSSISAERDLTNSANTIWSMADLARSEAISRSTPVQLVIATGPGAPASDTPPYRALSLWAYDPTTSGFTLQISKWQHLPNSVQISTETDPYTKYGVANGPGNPGVHFNDTSTTTGLGANTASVTLSGQTVTGNYIQFQPSGSVYIPANLGFSTNLYIFVLKTSAAANPVTPLKDWRLVQIGTLVGQSKVVAP